MDDEHSAFCIKSIVRSVNPVPDVKAAENFEFGEALESVYPLLDIIFNYLTNKDLDNIIRVKKSWSEIAQRILNKRQTISWVSCYKKHKKNFVTHSDNLHYSNANIGIILFDYRRLRLSKYICLHKDNDKLVRMTFAEYLTEEIIGTNVNYCLLSCPKVVSLFTNHEEYMNGSIFDGVLLPEIPGIRSTMFYCNPVRLKNDPSLLEEHIKSNEEIKCVLFFALSDSHRSIENLFQVFFRDTKPKDVAVGGGIIRGSKWFHTNPNSTKKKIFAGNDTFCIAFLKESGTNPNFNSASFVINGNDLSKQEFHEEVLNFRKRVIIRNHSVGFRICCGAKWEKDEESIIFHKHFPNTPLLGLEADGEIGWNCFNLPHEEDNPESKPKKSKKPFPKVEHEWSTVFVIITWGEILKDK